MNGITFLNFERNGLSVRGKAVGPCLDRMKKDLIVLGDVSHKGRPNVRWFVTTDLAVDEVSRFQATVTVNINYSLVGFGHASPVFGSRFRSREAEPPRFLRVCAELFIARCIFFDTVGEMARTYETRNIKVQRLYLYIISKSCFTSKLFS